MTIERKDRIKDTTSSTGTGTITVDGASITGYRPLSTHTSGATVRYLIISPTQSEWEVGEGVWTAAGSTLSRVTVFASSNAGSKVNFAAGVKYVSTLPTAQDLDDARSDLIASFSLTATAGKSPLADASGKIDPAWLDPIAGVSAAALHRSPNAIAALFVYDTSKDSDGGAWTERCQHTSWYNETIYGKWLGAQASEAAARAVSGATTGDYFQLSTDGKFYKLNAGSGTTEVFRGNKRAFPKLAAIVAEAASVTIYDLTEPGRPMAFRFVAATNNMVQGTVSSAGAMNGDIVIGSNSGAFRITMPRDAATRYSTAADQFYKGNVAQRGGANGYA